MYGAIIGDIVGSRWEFKRIKRKDFPLFSEKNGITDDSVLTVAVADALLNQRDPAEALRDWARRVPLSQHVGGYGGKFSWWVSNPVVMEPYNSYGNGSAMRVSPAGFLARSLDEALAMADLVTAITHNHPEGMKGARATTHAIYMARNGATPREIRSVIADTYAYDLSASVDEIRPTYTFNESCQRTVPQALTCALEAQDFEDALRNAVSLGGDADTLAAIAGPVAEALYGIPAELGARAWAYVPMEMRPVIEALYDRVQGKPA
ncbi:MAG: ADP-ribosylglycohydrolase family protein [Pseudomonadota bacterium]